ncbi:MAG: hypothetical protein F4053_17465 [Proteobacteria bacterium]|nr:hypothetical protein [Pseudomonadota bacterium]
MSDSFVQSRIRLGGSPTKFENFLTRPRKDNRYREFELARLWREGWMRAASSPITQRAENEWFFGRHGKLGRDPAEAVINMVAITCQQTVSAEWGATVVVAEFVINLDWRQNRWRAISVNLRRIGQPPTRMSAMDARALIDVPALDCVGPVAPVIPHHVDATEHAPIDSTFAARQGTGRLGARFPALMTVIAASLWRRAPSPRWT